MSAAARRLAEARVAIVFLTRVPLRLGGEPAPSIGAASWAFPVCGVLVGAVSWLAFAGATLLSLPPLVCAVIAVAAGAILTGALHEDGLADVADGFGGGRDRGRKLEIMRDSAIGSYGVLALILTVALRAGAIAQLASLGAALPAFIAMAAASRSAMLAVMTALPPARADGLGQMAGAPTLWRIVTGLTLGALALAPLGWAAAAAALGIALGAAAVAILAWRQIGGQTGDVLGAAQQIAEVGGWLALIAAMGHLS